MNDALPLAEVASELGVSRRRVQAMVDSHMLAAEKIGAQWFVPIEAVQQAKHVRRQKGGRPLKPASAWALVAERSQQRRRVSSAQLDAFRRKVRSRADHRDLYVHPSVLDAVRHDADVVLGGRDAADAAGAPVDPTVVDAYVPRNRADSLVDRYRAKPDASRANLHLHIVADDAWPFDPGQEVADGWTAWLDLEDRQDRAALTLLDRLIGGRLVA